jgi:hypothetical protein
MTGFELLATRCFYRPAGTMTFQQGVQLVAQGLAHARELELGDMKWLDARRVRNIARWRACGRASGY